MSEPNLNIKPGQSADNNEITVKSGGSKKKGLFAFLAILVVVLAAVGFFVISDLKKTINLEDYIMMPSYEGLNGEASVKEVHLDESALSEKIQEITQRDDINIKDLASRISFTYDVNQTNLTNNDEVTITLVYDQSELKNAYKVNFKGTEKTFIVAGLFDYLNMDVFENLSILFEGTAPLATLNSLASDNPIFSYAKMYRLKLNNSREVKKGDWMNIGDTLTIELSDDGVSALKERGIIPTEMSLSHVIDKKDVDWYVTSSADIYEETLDKIIDQGKDECIANFAKNKLTYEPTYVKSYFMVPKDDKWSKNRLPYLLLVYSYQKEDNGESVTSYVALSSSPIIDFKLTSDDQEKPEQVYGTTFSKSYYYDDLDTLFISCVQQNVADYTYTEVQ